jgi:hypothetical protein
MLVGAEQAASAFRAYPGSEAEEARPTVRPWKAEQVPLTLHHTPNVRA